jgi:DNA-binding IclR family transcriptional regulator
MGSKHARHVGALDTTIAILETIRSEEVAGVTDLATALGMSKANVYKHVTTLCDHGFLVRDGDKYRLGLRFFELGTTAREQRSVYHEATPSVRDLAEMADEVATLLVPNGETGVYLRSVDPSQAGRPGILEGHREPLHETAAGLAVLACYGDEERTAHLPEEMPDERRETVRDRCQQIGDRGMAVANIGPADDSREIATPIQTSGGNPVGAVSLVIGDSSAERDQVEPNYRKLVKKTGVTISKRVRLHGSSEL